MAKDQSLLGRIVTWLQGSRWATGDDGGDPDDARRDEAERLEFVRRQSHVRTRLERLEAIADARTAREQNDTR